MSTIMGASPANPGFSCPVGFFVEYFDPVTRLLKAFVLTYFPDKKLQMVNVKTGKTFLSKTHVKEVAPSHFYIGATVTVCSRELSIVDYADESTRKYFESFQSKGVIMILPSAMGNLGEIVSEIQDGGERFNGEDSNGLGPRVIANAKMFRLDERQRRPDLASLEAVLPQNGVTVALEVLTDSRNGGFAGLLGVIENLRKRHGAGVFVSSTPAKAEKHARHLFQEEGLPPAARLKELYRSNKTCCTLCVVKPHIVRSGGLGAVISFVLQRGFQVAGLQMMFLGEVGAEELLLPYRGVVSYHADAVRQLKSGPCVALQIEGEGDDVVEEFREACGPADPEVARALYPETIRALLGVQQSTNAVHCTDLPEDGLLECQYIFGVLAKECQGA